ncbi:MAG: plastocyanin/azurin family copper-binding protein [Candidatus Eremiobacteraeota bacterium]|nr:plastocyanin/azurin family copper-binding protein [Candidatus Eremiobacteraeota bacterium]
MSRIALLLVLSLAACTPGAAMAPSGGGGAALTIDVSLTSHAAGPSTFGTLAGYSPPVRQVAAGWSVRFVNSDGFAHTATHVAAAAFPAGSPFSTSAQTQSGARLSQSWSTGTLQAGASSQTFAVDAPGTYLYGCFYHYGSPMRGVIVAQ